MGVDENIVFQPNISCNMADLVFETPITLGRDDENINIRVWLSFATGLRAEKINFDDVSFVSDQQFVQESVERLLLFML